MRMVVKFIWERNRSHKLGKFFAEGQGVERWAIRLKSVGTIGPAWCQYKDVAVRLKSMWIPLELHSVSIRI